MIRKPRKTRKKRRVKEPLTDELLQELLNAPDPVKFASKHRITRRDLPAYLQQLLDEKGLERPRVVKAAGLNPTYGYEIFTGGKKPSRDKLLQIVFAMECSLQEANRVLQAGGHNELYCKNRRDAIIIFCLEHRYGLMRTDQELFRFGEEPISKDV